MTKDLRVDQLVSRLLTGAALAGALTWSPVAAGQSAPVVSRPVVQALPSAESKRLNSALATIGRNPRDVAALLEAGDAARALHDYAAAIGFYRRADEASPGNARVKAGMASAFVLSGDPVSAIPLFEEADRAGATPAIISADRGLAYDLVGDNALAQRYYSLALPSVSGGAADELRTRLAVSQAIAGKDDAAYATLLPLLNKQDKPGWRTRAFTLAIAGNTAEAVSVAQKILPPALAENIAPYLRYMPRLTKAQQASAANLGRFPKASEIGRDDARIAAYALERPGAAGSGLIPKGEPLGSGSVKSLAAAGQAKATKGRNRNRARSGQTFTGLTGALPTRATPSRASDPDRVVPPEIRPTIERGAGELPAVARTVELPSAVQSPKPLLARDPGPALAPAPLPARVAQAAPPTQAPTSSAGRLSAPLPSKPEPSTSPASVAATRTAPTPSVPSAPTVGPAMPLTSGPAPGFSAPPPASAAGEPSARVQPASSTLAATPSATPSASLGASDIGPRSLADIFADLGKPTTTIVPAPGAVDIRMITPAPPPAPLPAPTRAPAKVDLKASEAEAPPAAKPATKAGGAKGRAAAKSAAEVKAAAEAKAKAKTPQSPAHPSRIWVQVGVGRDKDAIAFDWRRNSRQAPALFRGREPYISEMARTNRVLVGPFPTQKAAASFIADAKKQGFADVLPWTSAAGQAVERLSAS